MGWHFLFFKEHMIPLFTGFRVNRPRIIFTERHFLRNIFWIFQDIVCIAGWVALTVFAGTNQTNFNDCAFFSHLILPYNNENLGRTVPYFKTHVKNFIEDFFWRLGAHWCGRSDSWQMISAIKVISVYLRRPSSSCSLPGEGCFLS